MNESNESNDPAGEVLKELFVAMAGRWAGCDWITRYGPNSLNFVRGEVPASLANLGLYFRRGIYLLGGSGSVSRTGRTGRGQGTDVRRAGSFVAVGRSRCRSHRGD